MSPLLHCYFPILPPIHSLLMMPPLLHCYTGTFLSFHSFILFSTHDATTVTLLLSYPSHDVTIVTLLHCYFPILPLIHSILYS